MALIAMCIHDTLENERTKYTDRTFHSLLKTVDFKKHRIGIFNNGSCEYSKDLAEGFMSAMKYVNPDSFLINSDTNKGTAFGINEVWRHRKEGEHCLKLDNDVEFFTDNWLDQLKEAVERDPSIGICGAKRKDLLESPTQENEWFRSTLEMLPHENGQKWIVAEFVQHVIGTCQLYSDKFLKEFGYLWQKSVYSLDDSYAAHRAKVLGYRCAFLPHIEIDHIDTAEAVDYIQWKRDEAGRQMQDYNRIVDGLYSGKINPYYDGVNHDKWDQYD